MSHGADREEPSVKMPSRVFERVLLLLLSAAIGAGGWERGVHSRESDSATTAASVALVTKEEYNRDRDRDRQDLHETLGEIKSSISKLDGKLDDALGGRRRIEREMPR